MKRRDFIKVTARGSILALASPGLIGLLRPSESVSSGLAGLEIPGLEESMLKTLSAALSKGGQYADVYLEEMLRTGISLADGKVESVEYGIHRGGGVRVLSDWKTGYGFCDTWDESGLLGAAQVASQISRDGGRVDIARFGASEARGVVKYRISPEEVEASRKVEVVLHADGVARSYDSAIKQVKVDYSDEIRRILVCNSEGILVRQEIPLVWITVQTMAQRGTQRHPGYIRKSRKVGFEFADPVFIETAAREAARQAVDMLDAADAPSGNIPVVVGSGGGVVFHEAVGHGLEADGVEKKTSFYTGRVGDKVGADHITLVDDGSIANLRGSFDFDDEGTPSSRNVLIEGGVLKGYMYDLLTARKLGAQLTGNGRRESYMHYPLVRMTNTFILPGDHRPGEIIEATDRGIYARHLGGGEVDTATGNFTFGVREAYLIENGKVGRPVRGATLMGNGPEILGRIDMVANDLTFWPGTCGKGQWVPITSGAPTLRISSITVGGRG